MKGKVLSQGLAVSLFLIAAFAPPVQAQNFGDVFSTSPEEKRIEFERERLNDYLDKLKLEISNNWRICRKTAPRRAVIGFDIIPDGPSIRNIHVFDSSGVQRIDEEAMHAVAKVTKLRPLPNVVRGPIPVTIHFMEPMEEGQYSYENEPKITDHDLDNVFGTVFARDTDKTRILENGNWFAGATTSGSLPPIETWTEMVKNKWTPVRSGHVEYVCVDCKLNHSGRIGSLYVTCSSPNPSVTAAAVRAVSDAIPTSSDLSDASCIYTSFRFRARPTGEKPHPTGYQYHSHGGCSPITSVSLTYLRYPSPDTEPAHKNIVDVITDQIAEFFCSLLSVPRTQTPYLTSKDDGLLLKSIQAKIEEKVDKKFDADFEADVTFAVNEDGSISNVHIENTSENTCNYPAIVSVVESSAPRQALDKRMFLRCKASRKYFLWPPLANEMHELLAGYTKCCWSHEHCR